MKTIRIVSLSVLALSTMIGAANAQSLRPDQFVGANSQIARMYTPVDCMQRDGGPDGCSTPEHYVGRYGSYPY
jgi:hypothetical protein